jgi:predicted ArsR family transcriptional regulator
MSQASIETYVQKLTDGSIKTNKGKVFRIIESKFSNSLVQIAYHLNLPEKSISGRLTELYDEGVISIKGTYKTAGNTTASYYIAETDPIQIEKNILDRRQEKYETWIKSGLNRFDDLMMSQLKNALLFNKAMIKRNLELKK